MEKHWRLQGICIAIFLDDGWGTVQDRQDCRVTAQAVRNDLGSAGFIVNDEKSVWEPTQVLNWLCITWNSILGTLKIVDRRITKILNTIDHIINKNFWFRQEVCVQSGIYLDMQWIPRTLNQQADYISRLIDVDDWQTTNGLFLSLNHRWGPHSVDCFANYYNHKLPRFFSRFWNPNTAGVDFFIQPLRGENCWVVRPVSIVPRVLHYMKSQNAVGTVILPFWPSAHYWPLLTNKYLKYISGYSMHIGNQSLAHGRNLNSLLGSKRFKGYVIALRMEFLD